jgi:hypothetical protein
VGILAALAAPERGPGTALAALAAVEIVLTGLVPPALRSARPSGWHRWPVRTAAAARRQSAGGG